MSNSVSELPFISTLQLLPFCSQQQQITEVYSLHPGSQQYTEESKLLFFDQIIWLQIISLRIYPLQTEKLAKPQDMVQFHLANAQRCKTLSRLALPSMLKLYSFCGGRGVLMWWPASQDTQVKAAATAVQGGSFRSTRPQVVLQKVEECASFILFF